VSSFLQALLCGICGSIVYHKNCPSKVFEFGIREVLQVPLNTGEIVYDPASLIVCRHDEEAVDLLVIHNSGTYELW
jgi:hypothetical protein